MPNGNRSKLPMILKEVAELSRGPRDLIDMEMVQRLKDVQVYDIYSIIHESTIVNPIKFCGRHDVPISQVCLVGGFNPWKILVNGKDYPIYIMENKQCLKPPTRCL